MIRTRTESCRNHWEYIHLYYRTELLIMGQTNPQTQTPQFHKSIQNCILTSPSAILVKNPHIFHGIFLENFTAFFFRCCRRKWWCSPTRSPRLPLNRNYWFNQWGNWQWIFCNTHTQRFLYWNERSLAKSLAWKKIPSIHIAYAEKPPILWFWLCFFSIPLGWNMDKDLMIQPLIFGLWTLDDFG